MEQKNNQSIYLIFQNWLIFFILLAGSLYFTWLVITSFFKESSTTVTFSIGLKEVSVLMFEILKPLIELVLVIWISVFTLKKLGIYQSDDTSSFHLSPKNIFILSLLFAFVISSLVLTDATKYIYGVLLLFIGIYMGSNSKSIQSFLSNLVKKKDKDFKSKEIKKS